MNVSDGQEPLSLVTVVDLFWESVEILGPKGDAWSSQNPSKGEGSSGLRLGLGHLVARAVKDEKGEQNCRLHQKTQQEL